MREPRIGELFAGYGGLGLGVQAVLGGNVAWYSEIDKGALKILEHRFPGVLNVGDITKVDWSQVEPVDILTGGSPCQDLSHAGKRAGMTEGTRSNLWVAMREAIAQLRPGLIVWENVGGAASAEATSDLEFCPGCMGEAWYRGPVLRALGRVVGDLSDLGYVGLFRALRASDVGAPHGRLRYFLVAYPEHAQLEGVRALPGLRGRPDARPDMRLPAPTSLSLLPTPAVNDLGDRPWAREPGAWDAWVEKHKERGINGNGHGASLAVEVSQNWGQYAGAIAHWESLTRVAPAPTQPSKKGTPQLSAAFSEWLMGLPAGWVTEVPGITRNEALRALGNGVVPQQAAAALRFLLANMEAAA